MWLCKYDLSKECKGEYKDCVDCILDKIRAEIEEERNTWDKLEGANHYYSYNKCLEIIDKYKAERSDKE